MRHVLEHHRRAHQLGGPGHDLFRRRVLQAEHGEDLVHLPRPLQLRQLPGHQHPVHHLGHLDEPDPAGQQNHRQLGTACCLAQCGCGLRPLLGDFDDDAGGTCRCQLTEVAGCVRGGILERQAGGEDQFAAFQQADQALQLGHVHPADGCVQAIVAGENLRPSGAHHFQVQDVPHTQH